MKWFKKEKVKQEKYPVPRVPSMTQAISHHENRINNLRDEFESLSSVIHNIEVVSNKPNKEIDTAIFRMCLIKYEVDIREDLLKWLSS